VDEAAEPVAAPDLADRRRIWPLRFRRLQLERAMRPLRVVVVDEDAQHALEVAAVKDQEPVTRHSARTVRTKRSAMAFAFGARTGVFTIRMPVGFANWCGWARWVRTGVGTCVGAGVRSSVGRRR
jgi:hypothetical protein